MRPSELEIWVRDIVTAVTVGQPVEDNRVELKFKWIEADKAARQLAGHANSSRGEPVLWIVGVDERNNCVGGIDPLEFENWHKQVQSWFDGYAPPLITHLNVRIGTQTVAALYFETEKYAPYVVTNPQGGYPEFSVPWREGTRIRAAKREDLLRLLVPIVRQPKIRLATAKLSTSAVPGHTSGKHKHDWRFEGLVYITPSDESRVVIPYSDCVIWINAPGYATFRLWATFNSSNFKVPKKPIPQSINLLGKEVDITPPPPRDSFTIRCADTELIAEGPGSAYLIGNGYLLRDESAIPTGNISVQIEILPSGSERTVSLEATLKPVKSQFGTSFSHEWQA